MMTVFRNLKNGRLYSMSIVSPLKFLGQWKEANALYGTPDRIKINNSNESNFVAVSQKQGNFVHLLP